VAWVTQFVLVALFYRPVVPKQVKDDKGKGMIIHKPISYWDALGKAFNQTLGLMIMVSMLESKIVFSSSMKWAATMWPFWLSASTLLCMGCCGCLGACILSAPYGEESGKATAEAEAAQESATLKIIASLLRAITWALIPMAICAIIFLKYLTDELDQTAHRGAETVLAPLLWFKIFQVLMALNIVAFMQPHHIQALGPSAGAVQGGTKPQMIVLVRQGSTAGIQMIASMSGSTHAQHHAAQHSLAGEQPGAQGGAGAGSVNNPVAAGSVTGNAGVTGVTM
jgi:hypothetical protein